MTEFIKKPVSLGQDSIGTYIKKIREKKGLRLLDISNKIGIKVKYLNAIESGRYKDLPRGVYSKIFFKKYISFLEIRHKNLVNDFMREQGRDHVFESSIFFNKVVSWKNLLSLPRIFRALFLFAIVLVCFLYLFFYFKNIFSPPDLKIIYPENNQTVSDFYIRVEGVTEVESEVRINDQLILIDTSGRFLENINVILGVNNITVKAKKKYSKENVVIRQILVK